VRLGTFVALWVTATSCSHSGAPTSRLAGGAAGPDYCAMATTALNESIKSNREQPYGLEAACVQQTAAASGRIYVDARFMDGPDLATVPVRSCAAQNYLIRFDPKHFEPSPGAGVVLLLVSTRTPQGREFNARVEQPNWPARPAGTAAPSPCGSAFGVLTGSGSRWAARVVPPPRGPDDL